jgi:hypothetical protein
MVATMFELESEQMVKDCARLGIDVKVISDYPVLHTANTRGVVIGRTQIIETMGKKFKCDIWYNWDTGKMDHVDSNEIV